MKHIVYLVLLFSSLSPTSVFAQVEIQKSQAEIYEHIPQEKVFLHYNNSLLLSGEYIYYKLYTINEATGNLSSLSKIAYVELVGEDGSHIFRHKVKLENGSGRGDFFIPTAVPSGNYKLLGYTQWMLNGGEKNIFRSDVAIVNPYRGDQSAVTPLEESEISDSLGPVAEITPLVNPVNSHLQLHLSKRNFSHREPVRLKIIGKELAASGNYSVSVRKSENFEHSANPRTITYDSIFRRFEKNNKTEVYLPELRGELLWGRIIAVENSGLPIENIKVFLSIPGEDYVMKVARTNQNGEFYFNIDKDYSGTTAFLEIVGVEKEQYQIELSASPEIDHRALDFSKFYISPEMEDAIVQRSVYNQIENAYYEVKPDTLITPNTGRPFYEIKPILYDLDDFTRFPTFRETFIEIVKEVYVRIAAGISQVKVRTLENSSDNDLPPLILVDGVVVQDHTTFLSIPAVEIQSIGVITSNYYLGPHMFEGILDVKTKSGNFHERYAPANVEIIELKKIQPTKQYFKQQYINNNNENIPDFRYQLMWEPEVKFKENEAVLEFYTSDVKGDFVISLEGFSGDGNPVSLREMITVE